MALAPHRGDRALPPGAGVTVPGGDAPLAAYAWALERIRDITTMPAERRGDADWLRHVVVLAHSYAKAGLLGEARLEPPVLEGQIDLFEAGKTDG